MSNRQHALTLTVYGREECQLCDKLIASLSPWQNHYSFDIRKVDIDTDAQLTAMYAARIPVLALDDIEICQYFLDEERLQQVLSDKLHEIQSSDKY